MQVTEKTMAKIKGSFAGLKVMMLLVLITTEGRRGQNIAKLNDGIIFQKVKSEPFSHTNWNHVFAFEIPTELIEMNIADVLTNNPGEAHVQRVYTECIQSIDRRLYPEDWNETDRWGTEFNETNDVWNLCRMLERRLEVAVHGIQKIYKQLRVVQHEIHSLLPPLLKTDSFDTMFTREGQRPKRAVLVTILAAAAIGAIAGAGLAGWANSRDIEVLRKQAIAISRISREHRQNYRTTVGQLASFSKMASDRMDSLERMIHQNALNTHKIIMGIDNRVRILETDNELKSRMDGLKWSLWAVKDHLTDFRNALQLLKSGFLPVQLISDQTMLDVISNTARLLNRKGLSLIELQPKGYFTKARLLSVVHQGRLLIMLNLPISAFGRVEFHTFKVQLLDLPIPGETNAFMRLQTEVKGLTVGEFRDEVYYIEHDAESMMIEQGLSGKGADPRFIQEKMHILRKDWNSSCIMSILRDEGVDIKRLCRYDLYPRGLKASAFWLEDNKVVLTAVNSFAIYIRKNELDLELVSNSTEPCRQCLVNLPEDGVLKTEEFVILGESSKQSLEIQYLTNRPFAQMWFTEEDLAVIRGDALFEEMPVMKLPSLNLRSLETYSSSVESKEIKYDMHKLVDLIKNHSDNVKDWSDRGERGKTDTPFDFTR
jgi:hypothetical protein